MVSILSDATWMSADLNRKDAKSAKKRQKNVLVRSILNNFHCRLYYKETRNTGIKA